MAFQEDEIKEIGILHIRKIGDVLIIECFTTNLFLDGEKLKEMN